MSQTMTPTQLVLRYTAFAVISTVLNLGTQWGVFRIAPPDFQLVAAIFFGTGVGLVSKYILDKKWIFFDTERGAKAHSRKFFLYTLMGVGTTLIFWGLETAFYWIFKTEIMTFVGGGLGLAIGYVVKYHLDKAFVFQRSAL